MSQIRRNLTEDTTLKEINESNITKDNIFFTNSIKDVFIDSQHLHWQENCLKNMKFIYNSVPIDLFVEHFNTNLLIILKNLPKSPFTKYSLTFVSRFIITIENSCKLYKTIDEENIQNETFLQQTGITLLDMVVKKLLLNTLKSSNLTIRHNTCVLLDKILENVTDISKDTYNLLQTALLDQMIDRNQTIRFLVANCLKRFQVINNPRHPVGFALIFHLQKDPHFQVRLTILSFIEIVPHTLQYIVERTQDIKAIIRKTAFVRISESISIKKLNFDQRLSLIINGLNDKNESVRKVFETRVLNSWIKEYNEDLIKLLIALDIQSDPENIEKMLKILFKQYLDTKEELWGTKLHQLVDNFRERFLDTSKLLLKEHQTPENVFMWRCLNNFLKENEEAYVRKAAQKSILTSVTDSQQEKNNLTSMSRLDEINEISESLLPELPHFCNFFENFCLNANIENYSDEELLDLDFIYCQFSKQLYVYDVIDAAQESSILKLVAMTSLSRLYLKFSDCFTLIIKYLASKVYKEPKALLKFLAESTSRIYNEAIEALNEDSTKMEQDDVNLDLLNEYEEEYSKIVVNIEKYKNLLDDAIKSEDYIVAQKMKDKLTSLNEDRQELIKLRNQLLENRVSQPHQIFDINRYPEQLFQCLLIFSSCLQNGNLNFINATILTNVEKIVLPGLLNSSSRIRNVALKSLGLSCLLSDKLFKQHFNLILQVIKYDEESVRITALKCLFDCLCKFGVASLIEGINSSAKNEHETSKVSYNSLEEILETKCDSSDNINVTESENVLSNCSEGQFSDISDKTSEEVIVNYIVQLLFDQFLSSQSVNIKMLCIEGLAKLLILGIFYSPEILSSLIGILHLPIVEPEITNFLEYFFLLYVMPDANNFQYKKIGESGQICLRDCVLQTLKLIYDVKILQKEEKIIHVQSKLMPFLKNCREVKLIDLKKVVSFMFKLLSQENISFINERFNVKN